MSKFAIGDRVDKATNEHEGCVVVVPTFERKTEFLEIFQPDSTCPALSENIFHFARRANHLYKPARLVSQEGRLAIVTKRGTGCDGRFSVARDGRGQSVRRNRVVLISRRW